MNENYKIIIPLIGVFIGWFLSSMSNYFKIRGDNRKILGKSIAQLYYIVHELGLLIHYLDKMKDRLPTVEYENHRQKAVERYTLKNEESLSQINALIDNVSSLSPSIGISLKFSLENYILERKVKFDKSKNIKDDYLFMLSIFEVNQDLTLATLEKNLIKLAFKYSIYQGFKTKSEIHKGKEKLKNDNDQLLNTLYDKFENITKQGHSTS